MTTEHAVSTFKTEMSLVNEYLSLMRHAKSRNESNKFAFEMVNHLIQAINAFKISDIYLNLPENPPCKLEHVPTAGTQ